MLDEVPFLKEFIVFIFFSGEKDSCESSSVIV